MESDLLPLPSEPLSFQKCSRAHLEVGKSSGKPSVPLPWRQPRRNFPDVGLRVLWRVRSRRKGGRDAAGKEAAGS